METHPPGSMGRELGLEVLGRKGSGQKARARSRNADACLGGGHDSGSGQSVGLWWRADGGMPAFINEHYLIFKALSPASENLIASEMEGDRGGKGNQDGTPTGKRQQTKTGHGLPHHSRPEATSSLRLWEEEGQLDESLAKLPSRRIQEAPLTLSGSVL